MTKESCFSTRLGTHWQNNQQLCCQWPCPACRMSPVTSGTAGREQRVLHTWVSLRFTIRRKRNFPGIGVGFCREASADRKTPTMAFPGGCPLQSFKEVKTSSFMIIAFSKEKKKKKGAKRGTQTARFACEETSGS